MFKKRDKENVESQVSEVKSKKLTEKNKLIIGGSFVAFGLVGLIVFFMLKDNNNYLTMTDTLLTQQTGSFKYVFDIRTDKHSESSENDSVSDISDLENIEIDMDTDKVHEESKQSKKDFVDWDNKEGIEVVNWEYPKYKVVIEGNVKSTEPLEMNVSLSLATNYFNDTLTDIIVKDNKTYVNIEQLRYWLINSKDENLITLGKTLPENAKYVVYNGDEFNLYSTFAENSEVDLSRESNLITLYKRFLITMKTLTPKLDINEACLTKSGDIYKLNATGDSALSLASSFKSLILNIGSNYSNIISNQYSNKTFTDDQYIQAQRESDNVVYAFSDLSLFLGTTDLSKLGLQVSGNARKYISGKGSNIYESSLAMQFTAKDTDYSISVHLHKDSATEDVSIPKQSSADISTYTDKDFVEKYLLEVFNYLNVTGVKLEKQLELTPTAIRDDAISSFVNLVNDVNHSKDGFTEINTVNVYDFIENYRGFKVTDKTSDLDLLNYTMVSDFLKEFDVLLPKEEELKDTSASLKDDSRFPSLVADTDNFRIYADFDNNTSNIRCAIIKCYILNKTSEELKLATSDFSMRTMQSSKYPANYQSLLREYDNYFDITKAPEEVTINANGYVELPLYFVLSNGLEYMDLWYGENNLGVVIAR